MIRLIRLCAIVVVMFLAAVTLVAQTQGVDVLLSKARSLEARGRMDLASQNWNQVLLVNPNQPEALAGLARYAKQNGDTEQMRGYLGRLRKVSPSDPAIAAIEKMRVVTREERSRLEEAGRLSMQGKADQAMKIYHEVFGDEPPPGTWAGPFYETEAASTGGRAKAVAHLRQLCSRFPKNEVYRLWLARILTYDAKTRMEGFQLLQSIQDAGAVEEARAAWRRALVWEKADPRVRGPLEAYLQRYPEPELEAVLTSLREKQRHEMLNADKKSGYEALQGRQLAAAEAKFQEVLRQSPKDASALAGLAYVRLNQKRFDEAVSLFEQARALAPQNREINEGIEAAKFWDTMDRASAALQQNRPEMAAAAYRDALVLRPSDQGAELGLAQAMMRQEKFAEAEAQFRQVLSQSPNNVDAMAALGLVSLKKSDFDGALNWFEQVRRLAPNRADIGEAYNAAKFGKSMRQGSVALEQHRFDAAAAAYQQALAVRPRDKDALLGLAQAAEQNQNFAGAAQFYSQMTAADSTDVRGWLGLFNVQLKAKDAKGAINTVQRIPAPLKQKIETRPDYLSQLALAYYLTGRTSDGDQTLQRALDAAAQSDSEEAMHARMQVAAVLMDHGKTERAISIYTQTVKSDPNNSVAWEGLIGAYARTRDFRRAATALRSMPQNAMAAATKHPGFLNTAASVYSAQGQCDAAEDFLNRSLSISGTGGGESAVDTQEQLADLWMQRRDYSKAQQKYREIISKHSERTHAWRGYFIALHENNANQLASSEMQRTPANVRAELEKDPAFLTLMASIESAQGRNGNAAQLLYRARSDYQSQGRAVPSELEVQLAWALVAVPGREGDLRKLILESNAREDLASKQREAIRSAWVTSSLRRAEQAFQNKKPKQSEEILLDAAGVLPRDPRIRSALVGTYIRQRQYKDVLSVYETWGMADADARDYRTAAGAALATHNDARADAFLQEGLRQFPRDAELLRMSAKRAVVHGDYDQAESELKLALSALREREANDGAKASGTESRAAQPPMRDSMLGSLKNDDPRDPLSSSTSVGCQSPGVDRRADTKRIKPITATWMRRPVLRPIALVWTDPPQSSSQSGSQPQAGSPEAAPQAAQQTTARDRDDEEKVHDEIDIVQNRNTPFINLDNLTGGRTGDPGFGRLIIQDGSLGTSAVVDNKVRLGFAAHGVYLYGGTPDGSTSLQFGTLPQGATFGEQSTAGYGGEVQLSGQDFGLMFGTSPQGFPVRNLIGGIRFNPMGGPVTFLFTRDSVKDSILSYAGVRDPGTGIIWGGVVANSGSVLIKRSARRNGQYLTVRYSDIRGKNVADNWSVDGNAGFYFGVIQRSNVSFTLGLNVAGMHYDRNLGFFTLGQGGYFSPEQYYQAAVPISVAGRHKRLEYQLSAMGGAQYFTEDSSPFFPVNVGVPLPTEPFYSSQDHTGPSYSAAVRLNYRITDHVNFGLFANANNSRNFETQSIGFSLKFLIRRLPTNPELRPDSIPDWKGDQPFRLD